MYTRFLFYQVLFTLSLSNMGNCKRETVDLQSAALLSRTLPRMGCFFFFFFFLHLLSFFRILYSARELRLKNIQRGSWKITMAKSIHNGCRRTALQLTHSITYVLHWNFPKFWDLPFLKVSLNACFYHVEEFI